MQTHASIHSDHCRSCALALTRAACSASSGRLGLGDAAEQSERQDGREIVGIDASPLPPVRAAAPTAGDREPVGQAVEREQAP